MTRNGACLECARYGATDAHDEDALSPHAFSALTIARDDGEALPRRPPLRGTFARNSGLRDRPGRARSSTSGPRFSNAFRQPALHMKRRRSRLRSRMRRHRDSMKTEDSLPKRDSVRRANQPARSPETKHPISHERPPPQGVARSSRSRWSLPGRFAPLPRRPLMRARKLIQEQSRSRSSPRSRPARVPMAKTVGPQRPRRHLSDAISKQSGKRG
jgi:hypothetical protein